MKCSFSSCIFLFIIGLLSFLQFQCNHPTEDDLHSISHLHLPDDLEATIWAASPQFHNPTNIDVDERGRIWVTEAVDYRLFNNDPAVPHGKGDRIVILEDKDGDGIAESSKVFVQDEDLTAPLGIAVIGNQVFVSCSPSLIVYTDEDGDDVPDRKEVFLTGFGGYDHDHSLHAVIGGPDGKYYFNVGNAGPHIVTDKSGWTLRSGSLYKGGSPHNKSNQPGLVSDDGRKWTGGLALRMNSDGTGLKVLGHNFRNSYEITLDSYGNMWQNDNDDDGNKGVRVSWLMEGANQGYFNSDGSRTWKADWRPGIGRAAAHWHQEDPGVMPMGDSTGSGSPTGIVFYEGDEMGETYRGTLLSCEAGRNVILAYQPEPHGGGYKMERQNLITSIPADEVEDAISRYDGDDKTKWFRPSDIAVGTDGAWYIADWYDPVVGGHRARDTMAQGRIYRITPKGKNLKRPVINLATTEGQIAALLNPAINVRYQGFVALANQGPAAIAPVKAILISDNPFHQARAVWLLAQLGPEGVSEVETLLRDENPNIRMTAFRALRESTPDVLEYADLLADDPDAGVRREIAVALRDIPLDEMREIGERLAIHYESHDRASLEALGLAFDGKENEMYNILYQRMGGDPLNWSEEFSDIAWRLHPKTAIEAFKIRASSGRINEDQRKKAIVALGFIDDQKAVDAMAILKESDLADVREQALWWLRYRRTNNWNNFNIDLPEAENEEIVKNRKEMLALQEQLVNEGASMEERIKAGEKMAQNSMGGEMLIGLASEEVLSADMLGAIGPAFRRNPDQSVRAIAEKYFSTADMDDDYSIENISTLEGDAHKGLAIFQSYCSSCHMVGDEGKDIGPALTSIRKKYGLDGLLDAIIHPSAGMSFGYESWLITKNDGSTVFGFLQADGDMVTMKDMAGQMVTIPASDIASRKQFETSVMPEPRALGLSKQDVADVADYLLKLDN